MLGWRFLCLFLLLSQMAVAGEFPTAEQVIQNWIATQREMPVEKVSFQRTTFDLIFQHQTNQLCEAVYHGDSSVHFTSKACPPELQQATRPEYKVKIDHSEYSLSWDTEKVTFFEPDGTSEHTIPRKLQLGWFPSLDIVEHVLPPLFPGPVNDTYIHKFDWTISDRKPGAIWLKAEPKLAYEKDNDIPSWEIIVNTGTWQTRAARQLDKTGNREVVMVVR